MILRPNILSRHGATSIRRPFIVIGGNSFEMEFNQIGFRGIEWHQPTFPLWEVSGKSEVMTPTNFKLSRLLEVRPYIVSSAYMFRCDLSIFLGI